MQLVNLNLRTLVIFDNYLSSSPYNFTKLQIQIEWVVVTLKHVRTALKVIRLQSPSKTKLKSLLISVSKNEFSNKQASANRAHSVPSKIYLPTQTFEDRNLSEDLKNHYFSFSKIVIVYPSEINHYYLPAKWSYWWNWESFWIFGRWSFSWLVSN